MNRKKQFILIVTLTATVIGIAIFISIFKPDNNCVSENGSRCILTNTGFAGVTFIDKYSFNNKDGSDSSYAITDSIQNSPISKDRLLTIQEYLKLTPKQQQDYCFTTQIELYKCIITDPKIYSAISKYISSLPENKKRGDMMIDIGPQWISLHFYKIDGINPGSFDKLNEYYGYTTINGLIVYVNFETNRVQWLKFDKSETMSYTIAINGACFLMIDDRLPEYPIIFFDKKAEQLYFQQKTGIDPIKEAKKAWKKGWSVDTQGDTVYHADLPGISVSRSKQPCSRDSLKTDSLLN